MIDKSREVTEPRRSAGMPLRGFRVEVVAGPDCGKSLTVERERVSIGSAESNDLVLTDPTVSRYHVALERRADRIAVIDHGSTNGTRIGPAFLESGEVSVTPTVTIEIGDTRLRIDDGRVVMLDVYGGDGFGALRGRTPAMRRLFANVARVAQQDVSVLITGESGTGKELFARAVHDHSARAGRAFVTVDCAALPASLFASELFGHERGAFTGAERAHTGALERASQGTLFLDEIGELPPETQSTLLGCLERRRIVRLGGSREIPIDIRVVAATNRNLLSEVNRGSFRLDLFYRLAVVQVSVPPLRDRADDIPLLVEHFLAEAGYEEPMATVLSEDAMRELKQHRWPGNVRELRNLIACALATGLDPQPLVASVLSEPGDASDPIAPVLGMNYRESRDAVLREFERRYLSALLERSDGSVRRAAREAKMDRSYLTELLKRHGFR